MAREGLTIGRLATLAAVTPDTVRFYERRGLVPAPARTEGGYRVYDRSALDRVSFIRKAQALGLSLEEVAEVLHAAADGTPPCEHVRATLSRRLREVDTRLVELRSLRETLVQALARSRLLPLARACVCQIIESQELPGAQGSSPRRPHRAGRRRVHDKEVS